MDFNNIFGQRRKEDWKFPSKNLNAEMVSICGRNQYDLYHKQEKRKIYPRSSVLMVGDVIFDIFRWLVLGSLCLVAIIALTYEPSRKELTFIFKEALYELHLIK